MKKILFALSALLIIFYFVFAQEETLEDPVVISLDERSITLSEFENRFDIFLGSVAMQQGMPLTEELATQLIFLKPQYLEQLGNEIVLLNEAKKRDITVADDVVEDQISQIKGRIPPQSDFNEILQQAGFANEEQLRTLISEGETIRLLIDDLMEEIEISDEDLEAFYQESQEFFNTPEEVCARHILLETQEDAQNILTELEQGADFAELAKEHSTGPSGPNGGDLSCFGRGQMVPPFEEAAFNAEIDKPTDIVETQFGYHVVLVYERHEAGIQPLEQVTDEVREQLSNEALENAVNEIYENSGIEVLDDIILADVNLEEEPEEIAAEVEPEETEAEETEATEEVVEADAEEVVTEEAEAESDEAESDEAEEEPTTEVEEIAAEVEPEGSETEESVTGVEGEIEAEEEVLTEEAAAADTEGSEEESTAEVEEIVAKVETETTEEVVEAEAESDEVEEIAAEVEPEGSETEESVTGVEGEVEAEEEVLTEEADTEVSEEESTTEAEEVTAEVEPEGSETEESVTEAEGEVEAEEEVLTEEVDTEVSEEESTTEVEEVTAEVEPEGSETEESVTEAEGEVEAEEEVLAEEEEVTEVSEAITANIQLLANIGEDTGFATVTNILVVVGDSVESGQLLIEISADENIQKVSSPLPTNVVEVHVNEGDEITADQELITLAVPRDETTDSATEDKTDN